MIVLALLLFTGAAYFLGGASNSPSPVLQTSGGQGDVEGVDLPVSDSDSLARTEEALTTHPVTEESRKEQTQSLMGVDGPATDESLVESAEDYEFLPYPNRGDEDFARKYDSMSTAELLSRIDPLNRLMSDRVNAAAEGRFSDGQFVTKSESEATMTPEALSVQLTRGAIDLDMPVGLGRVWPVSRIIGIEYDAPELQVTYLTESEYPQIWSMHDERRYVAMLWRERRAARK